MLLGDKEVCILKRTCVIACRASVLHPLSLFFYLERHVPVENSLIVLRHETLRGQHPLLTAP